MWQWQVRSMLVWEVLILGLKPKRTIGPACLIQGHSTDIPSIGLLAHNIKSAINRKYCIIVIYSPNPQKCCRMAFMQANTRLSLHSIQNPPRFLQCSPCLLIGFVHNVCRPDKVEVESCTANSAKDKFSET